MIHDATRNIHIRVMHTEHYAKVSSMTFSLAFYKTKALEFKLSAFAFLQT